MTIKAVTICLVGVVAIALTGCATGPKPKSATNSYPGFSQHAIHPAIQEAVRSLLRGNPEHANALLNRLLNTAPRDPLANLLNGMAYHTRAAGEGPINSCGC